MLNQGYTYRERLGATDAGATVLAYLCRRYPHSTAAEWIERMRAGRVLLGGARVDELTPVTAGAVLEWRRPPWTEPQAPATVPILYEDGHVVAANKPAGLPTLPGAGFLEHTLLAVVQKQVPGTVPVHRLGRWTSGVVLFARSEEARAGLAQAFRERLVVKRYRALASGSPERDDWVEETPIGPVPHAGLGTVHGASPEGRVAESGIRVVERREDAFLADVTIRTGRPHQIRIHLAASGHPLVGDPLYPAGGVPSPDTTAVPGDPGYLLHAAELETRHPRSGEPLRVESACPPALRTGSGLL